MSQLWKIVQQHADDFGVREAEIARRMGTTPQTLNSWKKRGLRQLPESRLLYGLAVVARVPYESVLSAALHDTHYLPEEEVRERARSAATSRAGVSPAHSASETESEAATRSPEEAASPRPKSGRQRRGRSE